MRLVSQLFRILPPEISRIIVDMNLEWDKKLEDRKWDKWIAFKGAYSPIPALGECNELELCKDFIRLHKLGDDFFV